MNDGSYLVSSTVCPTADVQILVSVKLNFQTLPGNSSFATKNSLIWGGWLLRMPFLGLGGGYRQTNRNPVGGPRPMSTHTHIYIYIYIYIYIVCVKSRGGGGGGTGGRRSSPVSPPSDPPASLRFLSRLQQPGSYGLVRGSIDFDFTQEADRMSLPATHWKLTRPEDVARLLFV